MRVLLVEDDTSVPDSIAAMLKSESFVIDTAYLGEDGLEIGKIYDYDIILLDLMLPDIDGYEVIRKLRAANIDTLILILSGLTDMTHKVRGLGVGADDYLTKPFQKNELVARIQAIIRRAKGHAQSVINVGRLSVNSDIRTVQIDDQPVHLTGNEYAILELLALRKGTTLSKEMFLNHLYGGLDVAQTGALALCEGAADIVGQRIAAQPGFGEDSFGDLVKFRVSARNGAVRGKGSFHS